jgi:hypothetical protein
LKSLRPIRLLRGISLLFFALSLVACDESSQADSGGPVTDDFVLSSEDADPRDRDKPLSGWENGESTGAEDRDPQGPEEANSDPSSLSNPAGLGQEGEDAIAVDPQGTDSSTGAQGEGGKSQNPDELTEPVDPQGEWQSRGGEGQGLAAEGLQGVEDLEQSRQEEPNPRQGRTITRDEELERRNAEALARIRAREEAAQEEARRQAIYGDPPESWEGVGLVWITTDPPEVGVFDIFGELLGLTPYAIELRNLNPFKITLLKDGYLIKGQFIRPKEGFQEIHNDMVKVED